MLAYPSRSLRDDAVPFPPFEPLPPGQSEIEGRDEAIRMAEAMKDLIASLPEMTTKEEERKRWEAALAAEAEAEAKGEGDVVAAEAKGEDLQELNMKAGKTAAANDLEVATMTR